MELQGSAVHTGCDILKQAHCFCFYGRHCLLHKGGVHMRGPHPVPLSLSMKATCVLQQPVNLVKTSNYG